MPVTEFYETAVHLGFYGADVGGLAGKKDNVRKYWEDIAIKLAVRPFVERLLQRRRPLRVVDLGSGSGEGVELLTHVPVSEAFRSVDRPFVLNRDDIETYFGLDISPAMVEQGRANYAGRPNIHFIEADLSKGFPLPAHDEYDLYFSSYASLSHITPEQLADLVREIAGHCGELAYLVLDLMGRFSPEWPGYWKHESPLMLPYSMSYLLNPSCPGPPEVESYDVCYWSARDVKELVRSLTGTHGKAVRIVELRDRSILLGRHMDTGHLNGHPRSTRQQVNRLFHRDYRGNMTELLVELSFLEPFKDVQPEVWSRIEAYREEWNTVVRFVETLTQADEAVAREMIEAAPAGLASELKMLAWLYRNSARFPVVDFWASIMGPQIACVLRNLELNLPEGLGCGHGLLCVLELSSDAS